MKPSLLLLHGALCKSTQFDLLIEKLRPYFEVRSFDFSGHSHDAYESKLGMDIFIEDICRFMDENKIHQSYFFGYSMGGYAAVNFAAMHPDKVIKIMTLGTKWDWDPASSAKEVAMLDPDMMMEKIPAYVVKLQSLFGEKNWTNVVQKTAALMFDLGHGGALEDDDFKKIETEVLILRGSEDKMVTAASSMEVASWLKYGTYQEIDGAPHPLEKVDMDRLVDRIVKYCV